jgi:urease accessory protein
VSPGDPTDGAAGWRAELTLRFAADEEGGATRLVDRRHTGPLVVQRPFFPEGDRVPHVYVLHPPGGLVGGDRLCLDVTAGAGAHALLTTPAATKVYRSAGPLAVQTSRFEVGKGACLEWLPQETILHDGAHVRLAVEVRLAADARFIGIDTLCFGLSARGETFATGRCRQRFEIWRDDRPIFVERGRFDADDAVHAAGWGLGGARLSGLMVIAAGPVTGDVVARLRVVAGAVPAPARAGVTVLGEGEVLVCRYLGASAERARTFFQDAWTIVRPDTMGRPAVAPRIWAT